jgi:hypothetical protein
MTRLLWPLTVLIICLPVAILATGVPLPFLDRPTGAARPLPVPDGDQELAWLHTTTNGTTWERFVSGVVRAQMLVPGLQVDDSAAFVEHSTGVPEVVLSVDGRAGKLRVRWYKITGEATIGHWVRALAGRDRPPLAIVGGGSSDRAMDVARALSRQQDWNGDRPLLLITTATADEVLTESEDPTLHPDQLPPSQQLIDVYDDRSFRFCFTNRQMADAVLDFVWDTPGLRPGPFAALAPLAVCSGAAAANPRPAAPPHVLSVYWQDDPYSVDLHEQFKQSLARKQADAARFSSWSVQYSVGGFSRPNQYEARVAESMLQEFRRLPPQRSLLVLPTLTQPARRLLRTLAESAPQIGRRLVAVTGDGIPVNAIYRDGDFAWPVHALPVPLVLFTHGNPVAWDTPGERPAPPPGYELRPPNSTEDVVLFAEMTRVMAEACFPPASAGPVATEGGLVARANDLAARLRGRSPAFFDTNGNRLGGSGEYVVVVWPHVEEGNAGPQARPLATMEVWRRGVGRRWEFVRAVPIDQRHQRAATPAAGGPRG